ncbi:MAG: FtsX-like permease family protein, partial [Clostridia bacterium]|nr:FtsX-like permease family protein [Clostridia bacterium]
MTFYEITVKMLRVNFRRYRLYFACNVFCIVLFYCFAALLTNRTFMNYHVNDSMISSNVIAPSVFVGAFVLVFVPYTYRAFMKNRSYEYGVFMTLGMSEQQALLGMLLENGLVAAASLLAGLAAGTILSFFFFMLVHAVFTTLSFQWLLDIRSYLWTAALYAAAMLLTLIAGGARFARAKLTDLLREKFRAEKAAHTPFWLLPLGLLLVAASALMMLLSNGTGIWAIGILVIAAGLFLTVALPWAPAIRTRRLEAFRQRHLLGLAFVRQHGSSGRRLCFFTLWMFAFTALFAGICLLLFPINRQYAFTYNPFSLEYAQDGGNQVQSGEVNRLLRENGVTVTSEKSLTFVGNAAFNIFPASELNQAFGCRYTVKSGEYVD